MMKRLMHVFGRGENRDRTETIFQENCLRNVQNLQKIQNNSIRKPYRPPNRKTTKKITQ